MSHELQQSSAEIDGLHVEWLEAGEGPLAVCLHGFPDSAYTWKHLLPELADAGYRAVAPWTRGYFPTGVAPDGLYQTGARGQDACRLHEALGGDENAVIIGHDFGAGAATVAAVMEPDRWRRVVTMAVPPGGRMTEALVNNYAQLRRSSYMFIFQHALSEAIVPNNDWAFIRGLWQDWSPGLAATNVLDQHVGDFIAAAEPDGHLSAMLGYYRAAFQPELTAPALADWQAAASQIPPHPTMYLHGRNDGCIGIEVADGVEADLTAGSRMVVFDDLGHFMQLEDPERVNATIIDFLRS